MKLFATMLLVAWLTACGGGDIQDVTAGPITVYVTVEPGAITCSNCTVTIGPSGAASAPAAPVVVPPVVVPLAIVQERPGVFDVTGQFRFTAGGIEYMLTFRDVGWAQFAYLFSNSNPGSQTPTWNVEALIDEAFDINPPTNTDDAIRAYMLARVLPPLNKWLAANSSRFAGGVTFAPVSGLAVPSEWSALRRTAALLPQWLVITDNVANLR